MASPFSYKDLVFPLGGIDRKYAFQSQPPYTTPDAVNVRPETLPDRRCRGGSRPGVIRYVSDALEGKVNVMGVIKGARYEFLKGVSSASSPDATSYAGVDGSYLMSLFDDFTGASVNTNAWDEIDDYEFPMVDENPPDEKYLENGAACHKAFSYDGTKPYDACLYISQYRGKTNSGAYSLFVGLDDSSPSLTGQGICAKVSISTLSDSDETATEENLYTGYKTAVTVWLNGTQVFSGESPLVYGELRIRVSGDKATVSFGGTVLHTISSIGTLPGSRFAFLIECAEDTNVAPVDYFTASYYLSANLPQQTIPADQVPGALVLNPYADIFVAGANGKIYKESPQGTMTCSNASGIQTEQKGRPVMTASRLTDLFVADYRDILDGSIHKTSGFSGEISSGVLTSEGVSDWTTFGIVAGSDVVTISNADDGVAVGTYKVSAVATSGITLDGYEGSDGSCVYTVDVSPKIFNSNDGTYVPWIANIGAVPSNCPLICLYRDRMVLAGAADNPHLWYMSRQGDPFDWNYVEDTESEGQDYGIAVAGQNSNAGVIGKPIRALVPHSDDYLIFGYDDEIWMLRGDPAAGGQIDCMSREVGIVGKRAWCFGEYSEVYFLSREGVYSLSAGYSAPKQISRARIPDELRGLSFKDNIQLVYDHEWHGIHLFIEGKGINWFMDLENGGFWKIEFSNGMDVSMAMSYDGKTLMGATDGNIRKYDREAMTDDGVPFESRVVLGPVRIGGQDYSSGVVQKLCCTFDGSFGGAGVEMNVYVGREAQEAMKNWEEGNAVNTLFIQKSISVLLKRIRAGAMILEARQANLAEWWGLERIGAYMKQAGKIRE